MGTNSPIGLIQALEGMVMNPGIGRATTVVLVSALLYHMLAGLVLPLATAIPPPDALFSSLSGPGILIWLQAMHTVGLVAMSLPFALLIARLVPCFPSVTALLVALFGLVVPSLLNYLPHSLAAHPTPYFSASAGIDILKFLIVLPLITWMASRYMPSNSSFKPNPLRYSP